MSFVPISLEEYVKKHLKSNPGTKEAEVTAQLQRALKAYRKGVRCSCGEPIWVIGASQAGNMCFTCITGEAYPDSDYEIREACDKFMAPGSSRSAPPWMDEPTPSANDDSGQGVTEDDIPF